MKKLLIAAVALIAVSSLGFSNAKAADLSATPIQAQAGQVPTDTLAAMGLGGMSTMSDADGMHVRGMGFVVVNINVNNAHNALFIGPTVFINVVNVGNRHF